MTIDELIARLEDCRDAMGGDTEVRLMNQASWPFEYGIAGITDSNEMVGEDGPEDADEAADEHVVYIVEGQQLGYGNKNAWHACY